MLLLTICSFIVLLCYCNLPSGNIIRPETALKDKKLKDKASFPLRLDRIFIKSKR